MKVKTRLASVDIAVALMLLAAGPAFAHVCTNPNKRTGAGSVGTFNIDTGEFTPNKRLHHDPEKANGGFVTVTGTAPDGSTFSFDIYMHTTLPVSARNAGPLNDFCDGKGVDDVVHCLGIPHDH